MKYYVRSKNHISDAYSIQPYRPFEFKKRQVLRIYRWPATCGQAPASGSDPDPRTSEFT